MRSVQQFLANLGSTTLWWDAMNRRPPINALMCELYVHYIVTWDIKILSNGTHRKLGPCWVSMTQMLGDWSVPLQLRTISSLLTVKVCRGPFHSVSMLFTVKVCGPFFRNSFSAQFSCLVVSFLRFPSGEGWLAISGCQTRKMCGITASSSSARFCFSAQFPVWLPPSYRNSSFTRNSS